MRHTVAPEKSICWYEFGCVRAYKYMRISLIQIMPIYHFHMSWSTVSRVKISFLERFQYIKQTLMLWGPPLCMTLMLLFFWCCCCCCCCVTSSHQRNKILRAEIVGAFLFPGDDYLKNVAVFVGWRCKIRQERTKCNFRSRPNGRAGVGTTHTHALNSICLWVASFFSLH